jgi:hypothetical protein
LGGCVVTCYVLVVVQPSGTRNASFLTPDRKDVVTPGATAAESAGVNPSSDPKQPDPLMTLNDAMARLTQVYNRRKELPDEEFLEALR